MTTKLDFIVLNMPEQPGDSFRPLEVAQMPDRNPSLQTITSLPIGAILTDVEGRRERALAVTVAQASVLDGPTEKKHGHLFHTRRALDGVQDAW